ncbi:MAG: hypothetical protein V4520_19010 [Bacteroidota bacterium]
MPLKIDKSNYEIYKKAYEVLWQYQLKIIQSEGLPDGFDVDEVSPIKVLNNWEAENQSIALKGLRAGLHDIISNLGYNASSENLRVIDFELKTANLPGIFEMYSELKSTLQKVLKTHRIKSIEEYYIIMEIVSDTTSNLTKTDTDILNNAITVFELSTKANANKI